MLNVVLQDIKLDRTGVIYWYKYRSTMLFSPLEPISNVGLYGTYTIYKGLSFKKHKPIGVFTDKAIVLSVLMLSFIFGMGFRGLKWKRIYVVFCSFYFSVAAGVRIADIGGIAIKRIGTANSSGAPPVLVEFVLFFSFMCSML
jgi:hypothetical protein